MRTKPVEHLSAKGTAINHCEFNTIKPPITLRPRHPSDWVSPPHAQMGSSVSRSGRASESQSTAKKTGARWLYPMTTLLLFLLFVSWVLQLAATAALQNNCGASGMVCLSLLTPLPTVAASSGANRLLGGAGFFGNTSCDKFYRFLWWIVWLTFFTFVLTAVALVSRFIHKFRSGLVGLLAVLTVLLMERTDTMLYASEIAGGVDGTLATRARVWVAGGIIGAFASGLLMLFVGVHNEEDQSDKRMYKSTETTTTARTTAPPVVESYPAGAREAVPTNV